MMIIFKCNDLLISDVMFLYDNLLEGKVCFRRMIRGVVAS